MKQRIFKKLCKKAAELIPKDQCTCDPADEGIYHIILKDYFGDHDYEPAWDWMSSCFDAEVNTFENNGEIDWKPKSQWKKPTPKNVFHWWKSNHLKPKNFGA